ncbi:MAG: adenylate/guanylate cyclase domain-containing protein [Bacteroidota bacterium]
MLFASINAFATNQKDLTLNQSEQLNVSSKVEKFYIDETGNLPAEEIFKKDFTNVKNDLKNSSNGNIWRKITISNENADSLLVQLNIGPYSKIKFDSEIYLVTENNKIEKLNSENYNGFNYLSKLNNDSIPNRASRFITFNLEKNSTSNILIKYGKNLDLNSNFEFSSYLKKSESSRYEFFFQSILIGGLISLMVFSLFVALSNKDLPSFLFFIWVASALTSTMLDPLIGNSGSRFFEFYLDINKITNKELFISYEKIINYIIWINFITFQLFVTASLKIKINYPKLNNLYKLLLLLLIFQFLAGFIILILDLNGDHRDTESILGSILNLLNTKIYLLQIIQVFSLILCVTHYIKKHKWVIFIMISIFIGLIDGPLLHWINYDFQNTYKFISYTFNLSPEFSYDISSPLFTLIQAIILICGIASRLKYTQLELTKESEKNRQILAEQNQMLETKVKERTHELHLESQKSERLMLNILPQSIATRLKAGDEGISDSYQNATILFSDLVGFTKMSSGKTAEELVFLLNDLFKRFDTRATSLGLEKIKTIGDAYMVAGGLPTNDDEHAIRVTKMALGMYEDLEAFNKEHGMELDMRIGINSGPVVAGVIGHSKFSYDLWGNTVNTASRMESTCLPGKVQVSPSTYEQIKGHFVVQENQMIECKGLGQIMTYFVK